MDYLKIYADFICDRRSKPVPSGYIEKHHVFPRSFGGGAGMNIIALTTEDHFFAHRLLAKIYGGKMWKAVYMMCHAKGYAARGVCISRHVFGVARREWIKNNRGPGNPMFGKKHSSKTREKISDAHKGKKITQATREKLSAANRGKKLSPEMRKKLIAANIGKKRTAETRRKISESNSGDKHPMWGKTPSLESRKKMSDSGKGEKNARYDPQKYIFKHEIHGEIICTQYHFYITHNVHSGNLSQVVNGKRNHTGGWSCLGIDE